MWIAGETYLWTLCSGRGRRKQLVSIYRPRFETARDHLCFIVLFYRYCDTLRLLEVPILWKWVRFLKKREQNCYGNVSVYISSCCHFLIMWMFPVFSRRCLALFYILNIESSQTHWSLKLIQYKCRVIQLFLIRASVVDTTSICSSIVGALVCHRCVEAVNCILCGLIQQLCVTSRLLWTQCGDFVCLFSWWIAFNFCLMIQLQLFVTERRLLFIWVQIRGPIWQLMCRLNSDKR